MCFKALREYGMAWEQVGTIMDKDHSTCIAGVKRLEGLMETEPPVAETYRSVYQYAKHIAAGGR